MELNRKKIAALLMAVVLLGLISVVAVQPVAAVNIGKAWVDFDGSKNRGVARLDLTDGNVNDVGLKSYWYAGEIIKEAKKRGYTVVKWRWNMAAEISAHAAGYKAGERTHCEVIDIELWTQSWGID